MHLEGKEWRGRRARRKKYIYIYRPHNLRSRPHDRTTREMGGKRGESGPCSAACEEAAAAPQRCRAPAPLPFPFPVPIPVPRSRSPVPAASHRLRRRLLLVHGQGPRVGGHGRAGPGLAASSRNGAGRGEGACAALLRAGGCTGRAGGVPPPRVPGD